MRVSYYYFLAGVRPASHPLTVSIFAFIVRSIWAIGHVLEIHLHFVVNLSHKNDISLRQLIEKFTRIQNISI